MASGTPRRASYRFVQHIGRGAIRRGRRLRGSICTLCPKKRRLRNRVCKVFFIVRRAAHSRMSDPSGSDEWSLATFSSMHWFLAFNVCPVRKYASVHAHRASEDIISTVCYYLRSLKTIYCRTCFSKSDCVNLKLLYIFCVFAL